MKVNRMSLLSKGSDYNLVMDYFMNNVSDFKYHNDYPYTKVNLLIDKVEKVVLVSNEVNNKANLEELRSCIGEVIVSLVNKSLVENEEIQIIIDSLNGLTREEFYTLLGKDYGNDFYKEEKLGWFPRFKNYIKKIVR